MNDSTETPEVDNQGAPVPSQATSEDGQTASVAERAKALFKNNKKAIITAAAFAAGLALTVAKGQHVHEDVEADAPFPAPASAPEGQKRQTPATHQVKSALVKIGDRQASEKAQAAYRHDTGGDLPPGHTYRLEHSRGG
ncbi:hypothetical protein ACFU53_23660 [Streptomyces sp. NPDC057474]|uniref:hypothetical protein n=1 Tax=Streptomyces sp. NPDC057474 TaxID=3346144 RepID=UPI0036CB4FA1